MQMGSCCYEPHLQRFVSADPESCSEPEKLGVSVPVRRHQTFPEFHPRRSSASPQNHRLTGATGPFTRTSRKGGSRRRRRAADGAWSEPGPVSGGSPLQPCVSQLSRLTEDVSPVQIPEIGGAPGTLATLTAAKRPTAHGGLCEKPKRSPPSDLRTLGCLNGSET